MVAIKHGFAFLSAACLLFASRTLVQAQQLHTLKYSLDATPKNILVLRGTNIEFSGSINVPGEHPFYMQCNGQVVEANSFREQWTLHFDTRTAKADYTTLTLHTGDPNGGNRLLARLHISITDKIPFAISQESFRPEPADAMRLRLSTLTDHKPQRVELTLDGHTLPVELDTKGIVSFEATEERLGGHVLGGRVVMDDDQTFELDPIGIEVTGRVRLLPFPFGNALDYSVVNGTIPIRVQTAPNVKVARVIYKVDKSIVIEQQEKTLQPLWWNPHVLPFGSHTMQVEVVDTGGKHIASAVYPFETISGRPKRPPMLTETAPLDKTDAKDAKPAPEKCPVKLVISTETKQFLQPNVLSIQPDANVKVESVQYYVGDEYLQPDPADPLTAFWDVRSEWPGTHNVTAIVTTQDGHTYKPTPIVVHVPVRVSADVSTGKIEITETAKTLPLKASFLDGITPTSTVYQVDGKRVATCDKAPFDTATIDASLIETGKHNMTVSVTDANGAQYVSSALTFELVNKPLDLVRQKEEQARQKEIAAIKAEIEEHRHIAEYLRRKNIVGNALGTSQRNGVVGRVTGLSVLTLDGEPILGNTLTVDGAVSLGTGKVTLLADAAADTQNAAEVAASICKNKILQLGYRVDWSTMDLTLNYPSTRKVAGDSAGVADTIALISACLKKPVDSSVAVTGAVNLQGGVDPVGGVVFKAARALSDPNIQTLIIPSHYANQEEIELLFLAAPSLFVSKRIILASNIDEVLRQAIIGYDKKFDQAEELVQAGIRSFLAGKDTQAINSFSEAIRLTPENATIYAWIAAVRNNKK